MEFHPRNQQIEVQALQKAYGLPLYIYDGNRIVEQYSKLLSAFPPGKTDIYFACKANTNWHIMHLLRRQGARLDVVSYNEGQLGQMAGFAPSEIHFTPNGSPFQEYLKAIEAGYSLSVDNMDVIRRLAEMYPGIALCIRINPRVQAGGHSKISVGHDRSKFGLPLDALEEVQQLAAKGAIRVRGMHIHTGSDIRDVSAIRSGGNVLLSAAAAFVDQLEFLDFGGGLKVPYYNDDSRTDIREIGHWIGAKVKAFEEEHNTKLRIMLEPGKFLVSEAGYFLAEVTQLKQSYNTHFVYLNTGFNHFIRPMYYEASHGIKLVNRQGSGLKSYHVAGYLCETDTFSAQCHLPELMIGDILAFHNAGAYAFSMSSNYNTRERPAEVMLYEGKHHLIRRRESFQDLVRTLTPLPGED